MTTIADVIRDHTKRETETARAAGMHYAGSIHGHYGPGAKPQRDYYLYVQTGGDRMLRILYVDSDYWVHTEGNGGFGCSWCCHSGTAVYARD
jgi:hypothetical protein